MTEETRRLLSGIMTFAGFFGLLYLLSWQVRIGPRDRQMWASFFFMLSTTVVIGQLCLNYLGLVPFGSSDRGYVSYLAWLVTVIWMAICTRQHNIPIWARMQDLKRRGLPPDTDVDVRAVVGAREVVVGKREDVVAQQEDASSP